MTTGIEWITNSTLWNSIYTFWTVTFGRISEMAASGTYVGATVFIFGLGFIVIVGLYNFATTGGRKIVK